MRTLNQVPVVYRKCVAQVIISIHIHIEVPLFEVELAPVVLANELDLACIQMTM